MELFYSVLCVFSLLHLASWANKGTQQGNPTHRALRADQAQSLLRNKCFYLTCGSTNERPASFFSVTGGRFKKEIVVDGQSYLLLIRDEGGPPELQV